MEHDKRAYRYLTGSVSCAQHLQITIKYKDCPDAKLVAPVVDETIELYFTLFLVVLFPPLHYPSSENFIFLRFRSVFRIIELHRAYTSLPLPLCSTPLLCFPATLLCSCFKIRKHINPCATLHECKVWKLQTHTK